uniref:ATP-dependent Clp protease proteolytic subunit n=1 Tax=Geranium incanum TaxID=1158081 RepID=A0A161HFG6_9ROSI|nr:ATP-dependent Clp protease proteolytic subunit [Geranium incanum]AMY96022.1 ATP-dependent Clp protease proteolytic subunit [Geranium incanum]
MPVGVPKVHVVYDSEGNIPVKHKKKNFDEDYFGKKFDEEFGDDLGEDSENEFVEGVENEGQEEEFGKEFENEKKVGQASENEYENENYGNANYGNDEDFDFESQKQVCFEDDDKDDNALEAAEKRKKKKEEEEQNQWYDLFEVLHREGVIFVGREMTMKFANTVVSLMIYLDREYNPNRTPTLFINSPGGFVFAGLAIYDTMDFLRYTNKVQTLVIGIAASMASVVLIGGGMRVAFTHARVMIHQPRMKAFQDESSQIALEARVLLDLRHMITEIYERKTTIRYSVITVDLERDKFMTAIQARDYGIVDGVAPRKDDVLDETF